MTIRNIFHLVILTSIIIAFVGVTVNFNVLQNFVDLAGSGRASSTHGDGARLKEGCHINLRWMTLTTVIRKLKSELFQ